MTHSMDSVYRIWNDQSGERIEIGDDADGLGLTEIRFISDDGKRGAEIILAEDALPLLLEAIQRRIADLAKAKKE